MKNLPGLFFFGAALLIIGAFYVKPLSAAQADYKALEASGMNEKSKKVPVKSSPAQPVLVSRPKVEYKAQGLRDPFWPLVTEKEASSAAVPVQAKPLPNFNVQGLVWGGVLPQAIINNKVVKKGDVLGEAKIVEIGKEGVTILFDNKEYTLSPSVARGQQPAVK